MSDEITGRQPIPFGPGTGVSQRSLDPGMTASDQASFRAKIGITDAELYSGRIRPLASLPAITADIPDGELVAVGETVYRLENDGNGATAHFVFGVREVSAGPPAYGVAGFKADAPNVIGTSDDYDLHDGPAQMTFVFGDGDGDASNGGHRAAFLISKAILGGSPPANIYPIYRNLSDGAVAYFAAARVQGGDTSSDYFYGTSSNGVVIERPSVNELGAVTFYSDAGTSALLRVLSNRRWTPRHFLSSDQLAIVNRLFTEEDNVYWGRQASGDPGYFDFPDIPALSDADPLIAGTADAGDGTAASRDDHVHPAQRIDLTAGAGDIDEFGAASDYAGLSLTASWQAPTQPFNLPEDVFLAVIPTTAAGRFPHVVPSNQWRALAASSAGSASGVRAETLNFAMGDDVLRLGRTSGQTALFAADGAVSSVDIRIVRLGATSGLAQTGQNEPEYFGLPATVTLPAPTASNSWGEYAEVFRYANSGSAKKIGLFGGDVNPLASWTPPADGGDRAGADFRIRVMSSADVQKRIIVAHGYTYVRNGPAPYGALTAHGDFSTMIPVVLDAGDYVLVEGRASTQLSSNDPATDYAGNTKTVKLDPGENDFWWWEPVIAGAASAMQIAGANAATGSFERVFYIRRPAGQTPTFAGVTFNGVTFDNLGGWSTQRPTGGDPLWMTYAIVAQAPGSTTGWSVHGSGVISPEADVQFSPGPPPWNSVTSNYDSATSRWMRFYIGSGQFSHWIEIDPATSYPYHPLGTGVNFRPLSRTDAERIATARLDLHAITDLVGAASFYTIGGHSLIGTIPFEFHPSIDSIQPADRGTGIDIAHGAYTVVFDQSGNQNVSAFHLDETATYNFGQGQYGVMAVQFQFQRPSGATTGTIFDSVLVANPSSFDPMRRWRVGLDLGRR